MNANTLRDDLLHLSGTCIKELIWNSCFSLSWMDIEKNTFCGHKYLSTYTAQTVSKIWLFICCKTKLKKKIVFSKNIYVFYKIYIIYRKKYFYMEKNFYIDLFFTEKAFFTENEKNIYLIWEIFFIQKIYIHSAKKKFLIIKKYIC